MGNVYYLSSEETGILVGALAVTKTALRTFASDLLSDSEQTNLVSTKLDAVMDKLGTMFTNNKNGTKKNSKKRKRKGKKRGRKKRMEK